MYMYTGVISVFNQSLTHYTLYYMKRKDMYGQKTIEAMFHKKIFSWLCLLVVETS